GLMHAHLSEMYSGTYKKAHRHAGGFHVMCVMGHGYSLLWYEGEKDFMRIDWKHGTVFPPADQQFHQHFATSPSPVPLLATAIGLDRGGRNCHMQSAMNMLIRTTKGDPAQSPFATEVDRRRTFAIISHPDAGKTTLTEKLLLFGGAIQLAGQVKAKRDRRATRSDWMAIERERGISVVTSVMTFEYDTRVFNLLDTPGHEDFSEDTYRTLTSVDHAIMVIDAAKGIEARTRKLFEVCRLRDIPIVTFINKMDRETRDPFDLLDEIEKTLALDVTPMTWPVGRGRSFAATYDLARNTLRGLDSQQTPAQLSG